VALLSRKISAWHIVTIFQRKYLSEYTIYNVIAQKHATWTLAIFVSEVSTAVTVKTTDMFTDGNSNDLGHGPGRGSQIFRCL
jgi:hypothetical protein